MNKLLVAFTTVGVVSITAAIGVGAWRFRTETAPPRHPSNEELAALKAELRDMKHALRNTQQRVLIQSATSQNGAEPAKEVEPTAAHDAEEPPPSTPEELEALIRTRQEEANRQQQARRQRLDEALQTEARDARWSNEATETVEGWLAEPVLAGSSLNELECRSTLCRARFTLAEGKRLEDFLMSTLGKMGSFESTSLHMLERDGKQELVAYLGREGQPLPK
ncbi:MAG TPA: hypothetical protein VIM73_13005 [Polyangiaceae bacterium]